MDNTVRYAATEAEIRNATVLIECAGYTGSGTLIAVDKVLTAAHCVVSDDPETPITVTFFGADEDVCVNATISEIDTSCDACLLTLSDSVDIPPITLMTQPEREGSQWKAFGYPASRNGPSHYLHGTISQILPRLFHGVDMDLSVSADCVLEEYSGVSGAAVLSENKCIAMVRIRMDGGLGAVSLDKLSGLLIRNGLIPDDIASLPDSSLSGEVVLNRTEFRDNFESFVLEHKGRAVLLEGSPGSGKTTFCRHYQPRSEQLAVAGVYEFTPEDGTGTTFKILPEVFADWLHNQVSILLSGRPARREETEKINLTQKVSDLLHTFSDYWKHKGKYGVIFIDAVNEASECGDEAVSRFTALLPVTLPENIKLVFTAPSLSSAGKAFRHWLTPQDCISLTLLSHREVLQLTARELKTSAPSLSLLTRVSDIAQGHPLYLRYILGYLKANPEQVNLETFPVFSGSIETYYERLWQGLVKDESAVNLLGILSRMRWGIDITSLIPVLTPQEQTVFVPTLDRIQHLLLNDKSSALCHQSFAAFINNKTAVINSLLHGRLADFCLTSGESYGLINRAYHLLLASPDRQPEAALVCTQEWADACIVKGARPDILIHDIRQTLKNTLIRADAVASIRLLLLFQRMTFRHHFLFLQSAYHSGLALAALGRPDEALEQLIPSGSLVVDAVDAIVSAQTLARMGNSEHALKILEKVKSAVDQEFERNPVNLSDFIGLALAWVRAELIAGVVDGHGRTREVVEYLYTCGQVVRDNFEQSAHSKSAYARAFYPLQAEMEAVNIAFNDRSVSLRAVKEKFGSLPENILDLMLSSIIRAHDIIQQHQLPMPQHALQPAWHNLDILLHNDISYSKEIRFNSLSSLIFFNAPSALVIRMAGVFSFEAVPEITLLNDENEIAVDSIDVSEQGQLWLVSAYLNESQPCPDIKHPKQGCSEWLKTLTEAVFWYSGQARRAGIDGNDEKKELLLAKLQNEILPALSFSLEERMAWQNSWAIPEHVIPMLYKELVNMFGACWPDRVSVITDFILAHTTQQCGLYSEGYRRLLNTVIQTLLNKNLFLEQSDTAFQLLETLHAFVSAFTENRQELVPELLNIIPAYISLDAPQLAQETYTELLGVSMGPDWYKEDQFALMTTMLRVLPQHTEEDTTLSQVAGFLEHASGEMTFRRYVRQEKSQFVGELIRRGNYAHGFNYYRQQSCGSHEEMLTQLSHPAADSPHPLKGMRFPGGAIDEEHAIECIVSELRNRVDWRLRWGLLEIFSFGSIGNLAVPFAELINELAAGAKELSEAPRRLHNILHGDVPFSEHRNFIENFTKHLADNHKSLFVEFISLLSEDTRDNNVRSSSPSDANQQDTDTSDDVAMQPGLFGKLSAIKRAEVCMENAKKAAARRNTVRASELAVESLHIIQNGDWSVWRKNSHLAELTHTYILDNSADAGSVIRAYASLVEKERYAPAWVIASHLIEGAASKFSDQEAQAIKQIVLEHNRHMLGNTEADAEGFSFLNESDTSDAGEETLYFLFWLLEHPLKFRRERALEVLKWLVLDDDKILSYCVKEALVSSIASRAEALMALTDWVSTRSPQRVWDFVAKERSLFEWLEHTTALSQVHLLERVADRAGFVFRNEIAAFERTRKLLLTSEGAGQCNTPENLSAWMQPVAQTLGVMGKQGIDIPALLILLEKRVLQLSGLADITIAFELEKLLARGFTVNGSPSHHRWEAMVRFALNQILHEAAAQDELKCIEPLLRSWNPASEECVELWEVCNRAKQIINAVMKGRHQQASGLEDGFFLHYLDEVEVTGEGKTHLVEISAVLTTDYDGHKSRRPGTESEFNATQTPDTERTLSTHLTCQRVKMQPLLFGGATPAVVSKKFMHMTGTLPSDFVRQQWRSGRSLSKNRWGEPISRGSLLLMKRTTTLPPGLGLAWYVTVDGELMNIFSYAPRRR